jgi:Amt family ammonium transporter
VKYWLGYDDALDVFGVHAVGGIFGALATGVFVNPALGGMGVYDYVANAVGEYNFAAQMTAQAYAVGTAIVVSTVVSVVAFKLVDMVIGLRVSEESEREGLDTSEHGERAYHS